MKNEFDKKDREVEKGSYIQGGRFEPRKKLHTSDLNESHKDASTTDQQDQDETPSRIKAFINMYDPFG
jgi:hypothetical protein